MYMPCTGPRSEAQKLTRRRGARTPDRGCRAGRGSGRSVERATLSSKVQISVPKAVREHHRWEAGQKLVFIPKGKGVLLTPSPAFDDLRGIALGADPERYRDRNDRM